MAETVSDLLHELAIGDPDRWTSADDFDPPFLKGTLRSAAKQKLIDLDTSVHPWRFRIASERRKVKAKDAWSDLVGAMTRLNSPPTTTDTDAIYQAAALLGIELPARSDTGETP